MTHEKEQCRYEQIPSNTTEQRHESQKEKKKKKKKCWEMIVRLYGIVLGLMGY
jgi:hypothetical protein